MAAAFQVGCATAALVVMSALPAWSTATHRLAVGQLTAPSETVSMNALDQLGVAAAGLWETRARPLGSIATHRLAEKQATAVSGAPLLMSVSVQVGVAAAGSVVTNALPMLSTVTHNAADGQETPENPAGQNALTPELHTLWRLRLTRVQVGAAAAGFVLR